MVPALGIFRTYLHRKCLFILFAYLYRVIILVSTIETPKLRSKGDGTSQQTPGGFEYMSVKRANLCPDPLMANKPSFSSRFSPFSICWWCPSLSSPHSCRRVLFFRSLPLLPFPSSRKHDAARINKLKG